MMRKLIHRDISKPVNLELLEQELRTALGKILVGVHSLNTGQTRITLNHPTPTDITTTTQIIQAHNADTRTEAQQTMQRIQELILGAVGKDVTALTNGERWAVLAGLLYQNKAIAPDMTLRHPRHWIVRQDIDDV